MAEKKIPWWQPKVEKEDYRFVAQALDANFGLPVDTSMERVPVSR